MGSAELPKIFVLSLERSVDRRQRLESLNETLGLSFTYVDAVDGRELPGKLLERCDQAAARAHYGRELTPSELGCHFSHETAWKRLLAEQLPWAVILEDDPLFHESFIPALADVANLSRSWDLIRLAGFRDRRGRVEQVLSNGRALVRHEGNVDGGNAYALSRLGAEKLLAYTQRVRHPVDAAMDRVWENQLELFALRPFPVSENPALQSTIRNIRGRTPAAPVAALERMALRTRRLGDSLKRRWHNLTRHGLL